jgi:RNA-directed DNA polymerase
MNQNRRTDNADENPSAQLDSQTLASWRWVELAVWSWSMIQALIRGVKGGRWYSLIDKVYAPRTLRAAWDKVRRNKGAAGVDHQTTVMFERRLDRNLEQIGRQLSQGSYRPQAVRRTWIPKPGSREKRPLGIPTTRDRVTQTALKLVLEPIFERDFSCNSYGFRPGLGCKDALARVEQHLKEGYTWIVDADLKSYFDTIPHQPLLRLVECKIADGKVLELIERYLQQGVMDGLKEWTPEEGTPQGAVISPLLANIYLDPLDHLMEQSGFPMIRYADDFVILCRTEQEAKAALESVRQWTEQAQLTLHPAKTKIVDATIKGGFDFLGYHYERGYKWPREKSIKKLKDSIREKSRRKNGHCMAAIIEQLNRTLRGWFGYFKDSHYTTFERLDKFVRRRLRTILRKRAKKKGQGKGRDHFKWTNDYFAKLGLFSLDAAKALAVQSAKR